MKHISEIVQKIMKERQKEADWKEYQERMARVFDDPAATRRQDWDTSEPSPTDAELARAREVADLVRLDRIQMDMEYEQNLRDQGVYDYEPYTEFPRPITPHRPHNMKPGGLAQKAHKAMLESRYGKK